MAADEPLQTSATDPEQLQDAAREERELLRAEGQRWRHQLSTYEGRQFVWEDILGEMWLDENIETHEIQKLGVRNKALKFKAFAQQHPELWLQMQAEAMKRRAASNRERRGRRAPKE